MIAEWRTVDDFYLDRGGVFSAEVDCGVWWRSDARPDGDVFRVSWVETGDVYAIRARDGYVRLLAENVSRTALDALVDDEWWDRCGTPGSLEWAARKLA